MAIEFENGLWTGIKAINPETKEEDLLRKLDKLAGRAPGNFDLEGDKSKGLYAGIVDENISVSWGEGESSKTITLKQGSARIIKGKQRIVVAPPVWEQIAVMVVEKAEPNRIGVEIKESWSHDLGVTDYFPVLKGSIPFKKAESILLKHAVNSNPNYKGKTLREIGLGLKAKNGTATAMIR